MRVLVLAISALLAGCATAIPPEPTRVETIDAVPPQHFAGPAEQAAAQSLQMIAALNPALHAVIATERAAGPNGIDRLLKDYKVIALVGPTMPPAWKIDAVNGDQISGGGAGSLAAVAGYPHLTVPMGTVKGLPVGLSFIGPKWSEALLLKLGYAYEQARGPFPGPTLIPSVETSPEIAPFLEPVRL